MSATKWVQVLGTFILIILPAAIHYRNWKHADRRTKVHRSITIVLLGLWISSALGVSWVMYQGLSRKATGPAFAIYVNGMKIQHGALVSVAKTNGVQALTFVVENTGDWGADGSRLQITLPSKMSITFPGAHGEWRQAATQDTSEQCFYTAEPWDIPARVKIQYPLLMVELKDTESPTMSTVLLRCTARNCSTYQVVFLLQTHPATTEQSIKYDYWTQAPEVAREWFRQTKGKGPP